MSPFSPRAFRLIQIGIFVCFLWFKTAFAHEPFDLTSRVTIYTDRIELDCTLGPDGVKQLLGGAGFSPKEIAATLRTLGPDSRITHPTSLAARFFEFKNNGAALEANIVTSLSEGMEIIFHIVYPRPSAGTLEIRAACYETIPSLRNGPLVVAADERGPLGAMLLSADNSLLSVTLPSVEKNTGKPDEEQPGTQKIESGATSSPAPPPVARQVSSFRVFFTMGVKHILGGIDHLLFLAALLIGIRKLKGMIGVITYFTLAHSITLALAALELAKISSRVVEPLIALSIIAVCCDNLFRREHEKDRIWLAGGFGLIHGFGFAAALQETGLAHNGTELAVPLLSFNFGVEAGQLGVAAIFLPFLLLLRRWGNWARFGAPATSCGVIAVSGCWLIQRIFFL